MVTSVILHTNYNTSTLDNDIAVLRVKPGLEIGSLHIRSVMLAMKDHSPRAGSRAVVSGWGTFKDVSIIVQFTNTDRIGIENHAITLDVIVVRSLYIQSVTV